MKFIYSYEDLFGDGEPTVDVMLRARNGGKLTLFQRMFLPDGVRHYAKSHIIMNFAYTEEDGRRPFVRTLVCGTVEFSAIRLSKLNRLYGTRTGFRVYCSIATQSTAAASERRSGSSPMRK
jgi:hypothetical protein